MKSLYFTGLFVLLAQIPDLTPLEVPAPVDSMTDTAANINILDNEDETLSGRNQGQRQEEREIKRRQRQRSENQRANSLGNDEGQGYLPESQ